MILRVKHLHRLAFAVSLLLLFAASSVRSQEKPAAAPDTLILTDGNSLHGTFVSEVNGTVTFHTDSLGDIKVPWAKIRELHATESFAILNTKTKIRGKKAAARLPEGPIDATSTAVALRPSNGQPAPAPVATQDAQYIIDHATLDKELYHQPGFFQGWNGAATAGATLVSATQNQYTVSGSLALMRVIPTVSWLKTRNRTSADFSGSFGKITQPAYTTPTGPVAATVTKTAITHFDAERDEYVSTSFFGLAQTSFDHNYSQNLNLQQIYGGGMGWTALKTPTQTADIKATVQYEKQSFITGGPTANQNLIGSTFSADYQMKRKIVAWTQSVAYIPAWNNTRAYSTTETDTFAFPTWKNLGFSLGTLDSYLNDPPASLPPTKRNSFQFTMGLTYAFKSKY